VNLTHGDPIDIVGGIYARRYPKGIYLRPYGKNGKMCTVKLHGDIAKERNIRLTSIRKAVDNNANNTPITISNEDYNSLAHSRDC
jgi:hypothetical protein